MSHIRVTPFLRRPRISRVTRIRSRISSQDNNTFHIDWQDQDKREIFKNLQEWVNNYRNIVLSCSRAALELAESTLSSSSSPRPTCLLRWIIERFNLRARSRTRATVNLRRRDRAHSHSAKLHAVYGAFRSEWFAPSRFFTHNGCQGKIVFFFFMWK